MNITDCLDLILYSLLLDSFTEIVRARVIRDFQYYFRDYITVLAKYRVYQHHPHYEQRTTTKAVLSLIFNTQKRT